MPLLVLFMVLAIGLLPARLAAQSPAARTISVNGSAEVRVAPDEVLLTVGIETDNLDIGRARAENDERVKAVVEAARREGVSAQHVQTEFLNIEPRYRDETTRRDFLGYFARRSLVIRLRDVSRFEALLSAVLTAGANYVHGIDFRTTELRKHRDAARALALTAAREKAAAMAESLQAAVGAPLTIQEGHSGWYSPYSNWWGNRGGRMMVQNVMQDGGRSGAPDDALVPGQISVSANVSVTFELMPRR